MGNLTLCASLLVLCLARSSWQGGIKPQAIGRGPLYLPSLIRGETISALQSVSSPIGAGGVQPGAGLGPAGAKAGKYPGYGAQGAPTGLGYGVPAGYGAGYRGYPRTGLSLGGLGARGKPSKSGYGTGPGTGSYSAQQAYLSGVGAGSYPSNGLQNGYGNGYGPGGNGFAGAGPQPSGYGNGAQAFYGSQLGGPAGDSTAAKYRGGGQLPYSGQPRQAEAAGLGDYGPGRYGDPSQLPYGVQPAGLDAEGKPRPYGNGNGARYMNGGDLQANGLGAAAYSPLTAAQVPGSYGSQLGYRGKESKYGMNGFLGNGYRGRCVSGKC